MKCIFVMLRYFVTVSLGYVNFITDFHFLTLSHLYAHVGFSFKPGKRRMSLQLWQGQSLRGGADSCCALGLGVSWLKSVGGCCSRE